MYTIKPTVIDGLNVGALQAPFPAKMIAKDGFEIQGENEFPAYVELRNGADSWLIHNPAGVRLYNSHVGRIFIDGNTKLRRETLELKMRGRESIEDVEDLSGTPFGVFRAEYIELYNSSADSISIIGNVQLGRMIINNSKVGLLEAANYANVSSLNISGLSEIDCLRFSYSKTDMECQEGSIIRRKEIDSSKMKRVPTEIIRYLGNKRIC